VVTAGMKPWEGCGECHGLAGVAPNGHFPNLAAQDPFYLEKEMEDFRTGLRRNDHGQMGHAARRARGKTLAAIVRYFASLPPPPPSPDKLPRTIVREGRALLATGDRIRKVPACEGCHGPDPTPRFIAGRLDAQPAAYLEKELEDFRSGRRANDPRRMMQIIARRMSRAQITAVSRYLASQPHRGTGPSLR